MLDRCGGVRRNSPYLQTWLADVASRTVFTVYVGALLVISALIVLGMPETRGASLEDDRTS